MKDEKLFEKAIAWMKSKGFSSIKANTEAFDTPVAFTRNGDGDTVIPDITGVKTGAKSYVEIALKGDNVQEIVSKWKLLSTLATMKDGSFYLLAPRGHKAFTERLVKTYQINAKIISI